MEKCICEHCNKELQKGDWPFCPHGSTRSGLAQYGEATVVFYNPKLDKYSFPASKDSKAPKGYKKIELTNDYQRAKFENEINRREDSAVREEYESRKRDFANYVESNKRNLEIALEKYSGHKDRRLIEKAMESLEKESKRRSLDNGGGSGFHIESRHYYGVKHHDE